MITTELWVDMTNLRNTKVVQTSKSGSNRRGRNSYKCSRCGLPKKGHVCKALTFTSVGTQVFFRAVRVFQHSSYF